MEKLNIFVVNILAPEKFAIPQKNFCNCVQKIKNKHDGGADFAFFVSACITHSLVERLSALTALLGSEGKSPGYVEP